MNTIYPNGIIVFNNIGINNVVDRLWQNEFTLIDDSEFSKYRLPGFDFIPVHHNMAEFIIVKFKFCRIGIFLKTNNIRFFFFDKQLNIFSYILVFDPIKKIKQPNIVTQNCKIVLFFGQMSCRKFVETIKKSKSY